MKELTIVRENLMNELGYSGYCGAERCPYHWPRTIYLKGYGQWRCACGWQSEYPEDFLKRYRKKWGLPEPWIKK